MFLLATLALASVEILTYPLKLFHWLTASRIRDIFTHILIFGQVVLLIKTLSNMALFLVALMYVLQIAWSRMQKSYSKKQMRML